MKPLDLVISFSDITKNKQSATEYEVSDTLRDLS